MSGHKEAVPAGLSATAIRQALAGPACAAVADIVILHTVDSTNTWLKQAAKDGARDGTLVIAETQTAGRGRMGRSFYSPAQTGLYMSILCKPQTGSGAFNPGLYTAAAAVAVTRALESVYGIDARIKWVNDVYYQGKKVCGILAEGVTRSGSGIPDRIITGIGVNIFTQDFPADLKTKAGSVLGVTKAGREAAGGRNELAAAIVSQFFGFIGPADSGAADGAAFMNEYRAKSCVLGKDVTVMEGNETYAARALAIDDDGSLIVERAGGRQTLRSGEISIRGDF